MLILEKNYSDSSLSLKKVSEMLGVSESYTSRIIRKKTNMPYIKHLMGIRIEKSKELLLSGISIENVAAQCGYLSISGYKKAFKQYTGMSVFAWIQHSNRVNN